MSGIALFLISVLTLAGIYAIWSMILNLEAGWAGMWDLGVAGLLAVGAYTFVITTQKHDTEVVFAPQLPMWAGIILSVLVTGLVALLIGIPGLRVRGLQFLIATLAFAEVVRHLAISQIPVTQGTFGFSQFDRPFPSLARGSSYRILLLLLVWIVVAALFLLMRRLSRAPFIRVLRGFRDNDPVALSLGKRTNRHRLQVYVFAGMLYGAVVPLYIWYVNSLNPHIFMSDVTFTAWACLVLGGIASRSGPIIGAVILMSVTETVSLFQGSSELAALISTSRWIIVGVLLILIMRYRPDGLISERTAFSKASSATAEKAAAGVETVR